MEDAEGDDESASPEEGVVQTWPSLGPAVSSPTGSPSRPSASVGGERAPALSHGPPDPPLCSLHSSSESTVRPRCGS